MTLEKVWIGNTMRLTVAFSNAVGAALPALSDVTIAAKRPDGTTVAGTVQAGTPAGTFFADFNADQAGMWAVRAACTGAVAVAEEERFAVAKSLVV